MNSEERSNDGVALWICPECAFTFDAAHTDTDGGGYSCPLCAEIDLESRLAAALARIAAVEAAADEVHGHGADDERAEVERLRGIISRIAALAASPTPTGPEPATCEHKRTQAHQMLDEFCEWTADCPGPATPTGPEPAKCAHGHPASHDLYSRTANGALEFAGRCPGPATPEPTEETRQAFIEDLAGLPRGRRAEIFGSGGADPKETDQ